MSDERISSTVLSTDESSPRVRLRPASAARRERRRSEMAILYRLTESVSRVDSLHEAYERALDAVQEGLGTERSSILLFDDDGVMRFKAWRGLSEPYRAAVEGHSPWSRDTHKPQAIYVADTETDESMAGYRPLFRREGIRALAFVPLVHGGRLLGKFMLYYADPREFRRREMRFARTIAAQIVLSVLRKSSEIEVRRLYAEAQQARQAAEDQAKAREHLMAIVSHDLRNPLCAVMTSVGILQRLEEFDSSGRMRRHIEILQRSSNRMERLIRDLLDYSAIEAGAFTIQPEKARLESVLDQVLELEPLALERGQRLLVRRAGLDASVLCQPDRLQQVFSNLVGNAVKFTPEGGSIEITARLDADRVIFAVRDSGSGLPPEQLSNVFTRYWRGRPADQPGVGLGLSIAKGIVEAHGGWIRGGNHPQGGALFEFAIPRA